MDDIVGIIVKWSLRLERKMLSIKIKGSGTRFPLNSPKLSKGSREKLLIWEKTRARLSARASIYPYAAQTKLRKVGKCYVNFKTAWKATFIQDQTGEEAEPSRPRYETQNMRNENAYL